MRIATWNVNSLPARLERVLGWLDRAEPDVLLLQETKIADDAAPHDAFRERGYAMAHHGEGRWNGVAVLSKVGIEDVITNFGAPLAKTGVLAPEGPDGSARSARTGGTGAGEPIDERGEGDDEPLAEARMIAARCGGVRVISIYAPNGRALATPFYEAKLAFFDRLVRWLDETCRKEEPLLLAGDLNVAPTDDDVWDPTECNGGTHVSPPERDRFAALLSWGLVDAYRAHRPQRERYSWWDYRAGNFHKNFGMRIDHVLASAPLAARIVDAEIDREARKGKPTPSDHAPVLVDVDAPGKPIDAGWKSAAERIAARRAK